MLLPSVGLSLPTPLIRKSIENENKIGYNKNVGFGSLTCSETRGF